MPRIAPLLLILAALSAQAWPYPPHLYPNSEIPITSIAEGPDGFLLLASDEGLFRFDGFHYRKVPGIPFSSLSKVGVTADGSLWVAGREGLARCHPACSKILTDQVTDMVVFPDRLIVRHPSSLTRILTSGSVLTVPMTGSKYLMPGPDRTVAFVDGDLKLLETDHLTEITRHTIPKDSRKATVDSHGKIWAVNNPNLVEAVGSDGTPGKSYLFSGQPTAGTPQLFPGRDGELWFAAGGLIRSLTGDREFRVPLDKNPVTAGYQDSRGNLWVARGGLGLTEWIPNPQWERWYPQDFGGEAPGAVMRASDGTLVAATTSNLYRGNQNQTWTRITSRPRDYDFLLPISGGYYASIRDAGLVKLSATGEPTKEIPTALPETSTAFRQLLQDRQSRIWAGNKTKLQVLDQPSGVLRPVVLPGTEHVSSADAAALALDATGRVWVGYRQGLAQQDEQGQWHLIPTNKPVVRVRSFTLPDANSSDIWVSYRDAGSFSRLRLKQGIWQVTDFIASAGYAPADTTFIRRDSRGWIWRGSTDGVHVSDGVHTEPQDWLHLSPEAGLATDEAGLYGFFEDRDTTIWISGPKGITHIHPDPAWFSVPKALPAPRITSFDVTGTGNDETVRLEIGSLETPPFRALPFFWRLQPDSPQWQYSSDGTLVFPHLSSGTHSLEVAYTGGSSTTALKRTFRTGVPVWRSPWLWLTALAFAAAPLLWRLRRHPRVEIVRFHLERLIFVLRRRFERRVPPEIVSGNEGPDLSGQTVGGRFELLHPLSKGGFSVVYEAYDHRNSQRVAVKVLNRQFGRSGWLRQRFAHEVAALSATQHPGIVRILDWWLGPDGVPCLAMPYLEGETLAAALSRGAVTRTRTGRMACGISSALAELHRRGIIHRDLKPDNIMLVRSETGDEVPILIDFGTAGLRGLAGENATTKVLAGSFQYLAPERLLGHYSTASDVYSFGVIVLEMLTGNRLPEIGVPTTDPLFVSALIGVLERRFPAKQAESVGRHLSPLFLSSPEARPADIERWSEEMAELISL